MAWSFASMYIQYPVTQQNASMVNKRHPGLLGTEWFKNKLKK